MKTKLLLLFFLISFAGHSQISLNQPSPWKKCDIDGNGWENFDLTSVTSEILGDLDPRLFKITFFDNSSYVQDDSYAIPNPAKYATDKNVYIYIKVTEKANTANYVSTVLNIAVLSVPQIIDIDMEAYETVYDGFAEFNLLTKKDYIVDNTYSLSISYHLNESDALAGVDALGDKYTNTSNPQTIWVKATNGNECSSISIFKLIVTEGVEPIVNIPDANFKAKMLAYDFNGDKKIQVSEAQSVRKLDIRSANIASFEGIKACAGLLELNANSNQITQLDVSGLKNLVNLNCQFGQLITLEVAGCVKLQKIFANRNQMVEINLNGLTALREFVVDQNLFTEIDFSSCVNLNLIYAASNQLKTIDVRALPRLRTLWISSNNLTSIYCKNGSDDFSGDRAYGFANSPNLAYICVDEGEEMTHVKQLLVGYKYDISKVIVDSFCPLPSPDNNLITGRVTFDADANGCDATDIGQDYIKVKINDGVNQSATFTHTGGYYEYETGAGIFTLKPDFEKNNLFKATPDSKVVNTPEINKSVTTANFCVTSDAGVIHDVEVVLVPIKIAVPGFNATYRVTYKNKGNQVVSGNVTVTLDGDKLQLVATLPEASSSTTNTLTWNFTDLAPFETRNIEMSFIVNSPAQTPAVNNGDILNFNATATINTDTDAAPEDNIFDYKQTVVNSLDPNDITCIQGKEQPVTAIGDYLHYVINFENIGTAAAEFVVVTQDINPADFDIESLELLNTSHNVTANVKGNAVEFRFDGINLAAKAHGSIIYKIKSLKSLKDGDSVMNKANIVFDFNEAIATNEAVTTFKTTLGTDDFTIDKSVKIYPNPAKDTVKVETNNTIKSIQLYDVQGRVLQTVTPNQNTAAIDVSAKAAGIYFLKVTTANGTKTEKLIKQ